MTEGRKDGREEKKKRKVDGKSGRKYRKQKEEHREREKAYIGLLCNVRPLCKLSQQFVAFVGTFVRTGNKGEDVSVKFTKSTV